MSGRVLAEPELAVAGDQRERPAARIMALIKLYPQPIQQSGVEYLHDEYDDALLPRAAEPLCCDGGRDRLSRYDAFSRGQEQS
jgi:hypothetical protein